MVGPLLQALIGWGSRALAVVPFQQVRHIALASRELHEERRGKGPFHGSSLIGPHARLYLGATGSCRGEEHSPEGERGASATGVSQSPPVADKPVNKWGERRGVSPPV